MVVGGLYVNLELEFKASDHWTVGPFAQAETSQPTFDTGLRAVYYEKGVYKQGWMTGFELAYSQIVPSDHFYNYEDDAYYDDVYTHDYEDDSFCRWNSDLAQAECTKNATQQIEVSVDHGYFWRFGTFNAGLGIGGSVSANDESWSDIAVLPNLYFSIGWVR
jgi:hypothetical protein